MINMNTSSRSFGYFNFHIYLCQAKKEPIIPKGGSK